MSLPKKLLADFDEVLKEAQALGYAEANPSADIDGLDTGRKTAISSSIAFSSVVKESDVSIFTMRTIKKCDIEYKTLLDKDELFMPQNSYTHLWGAKQAMRDDKEQYDRFIASCIRRIEKSYPEYSYISQRIESFYGENSN